MSEPLHIRASKEDRQNVERVRKLMIRLGLPASSITNSDVIRFALKRAAETK